ncbi:adenylyltransferase/cytidyltransferase family protein [Candidatus Pacearchaeota archaeon]|nr:adenylyltransferase/cytidyltransferase family protein [Candidatus Pacearchaeota archaeon]
MVKAIERKPRSECETIGICAGCFTILTPNHVRYLNEARSQCDYLVVITNFDEYVRDKKGVVPLSCEDRISILSGLKAVDEVSAFDGDNEEDWVARFMRVRLRQFASGAKVVLFHDETAMLGKSPNKIPGFEVANKLVMISRKPGISVSDVFRRIRDAQE